MIFRALQSVFDFLPWIDWAYLTAMFLVGLVLVISGLRSKDQGMADEPPLEHNQDVQRGFEVVPPVNRPGR